MCDIYGCHDVSVVNVATLVDGIRHDVPFCDIADQDGVREPRVANVHTRHNGDSIQNTEHLWRQRYLQHRPLDFLL